MRTVALELFVKEARANPGVDTLLTSPGAPGGRRGDKTDPTQPKPRVSTSPSLRRTRAAGAPPLWRFWVLEKQNSHENSFPPTQSHRSPELWGGFIRPDTSGRSGRGVDFLGFAAPRGGCPDSFGVVGRRVCHSSRWFGFVTARSQRPRARPRCGLWGEAEPRHPEGGTGQGGRAGRAGREDFWGESGSVTRHTWDCSRR